MNLNFDPSDWDQTDKGVVAWTISMVLVQEPERPMDVVRLLALLPNPEQRSKKCARKNLICDGPRTHEDTTRFDLSNCDGPQLARESQYSWTSPACGGSADQPKESCRVRSLSELHEQ